MRNSKRTEQDWTAFDEQTANTWPPATFHEPLGVCSWCKVILLRGTAMTTRPDGSHRHLGCK